MEFALSAISDLCWKTVNASRLVIIVKSGMPQLEPALAAMMDGSWRMELVSYPILDAKKDKLWLMVNALT